MPTRVQLNWRLCAIGTALLASQWASCTVEEIDLGGKRCPCADGWVCDPETELCTPAPDPATGGSGGKLEAGTDSPADVSSDVSVGGTGGTGGAPTTPALGRACVGSQVASGMGANRKRVSHFSLFTKQTYDAVVVYVQANGSADTQLLRGIVYSTDANGQPDKLIGATTEASLPGTLPAGWVTMIFDTPLALVPGEYWVGIHSGLKASVLKYTFEGAPGAARFADDTFADGPAATFGTMTSENYLLSVYARPLGATIHDTDACPAGTGGTGGTTGGGGGGTTGGGGAPTGGGGTATGGKGGTGGTTGGGGGPTGGGGTTGGGGAPTGGGGAPTGGGGAPTGGGGAPTGGGGTTGGGGASTGGGGTDGGGGATGGGGAGGTGGVGDAGIG